MVDFKALKTHVTSSWVANSEVLRLGRPPSGHGHADVEVGSFFGRLVNWVLPDFLMGKRHAPQSDTASKVRDDFQMAKHEAVRNQVKRP